MEKKEEICIEVTAYYERNSKRYRRFVIQKDERGGGIVGLIYVPRIIDVPERVVVNLRNIFIENEDLFGKE